MNKIKLINAALVVTSLLGYLEWGKDNHSFLFEAEKEVLMKLSADPLSVAHPLILLPIMGQMILLATLFRKQPGRFWSWVGMTGLAVLLCFICLIGLLSLNWKIALSTLPFLTTAFFAVKAYRR